MADKKDLLVSALHLQLHKKIDQVGDFLLQKKKQLLVLPAQRQNRFLAPAPSPSLLRDPRLCFAAAIPGDSAVEYVITSGTYQFLNIYNTVLIARIVLTWFPGAPQQIVSPLATLAAGTPSWHRREACAHSSPTSASNVVVPEPCVSC